MKVKMNSVMMENFSIGVGCLTCMTQSLVQKWGVVHWPKSLWDF